MTEIQGKSILVRVSARLELARVRVIGSRLSCKLLAYIVYQNIQSRISEVNTEFYTDDVLSSLNSILQMYTRVKKNTQK